MVEGTGLENRHTCKGIESSNLSLSVTNEDAEGRSPLDFGLRERCRDAEAPRRREEQKNTEQVRESQGTGGRVV